LRARILSASTAVVVALASTACSSEEKEGPGDQGAASAAASPSPSPSGSASADPEENGSAAAGVGLEALENPIATVEARTGMEDDPEGTVKIDVLGLKRKDKLLILTAAVTPDNSLARPQNLFSVLGNHTWRPTLVDTVNLKQYSVVRAQGGRLASADLSVKAASGQPMFVYAVFAAPPTDVTKINILFADSIPALTDVAIQ
jgi:hypothetical protein